MKLKYRVLNLLDSIDFLKPFLITTLVMCYSYGIAYGIYLLNNYLTH